MYFVGSASANNDYTSVDMGLTFPMSSMNTDFQCLNITILDDALLEEAETFTVTLTLLTTGLGVMVDNDTTTVTITDNEGTGPTVDQRSH